MQVDLKGFRDALELTQEQFGQELGVVQSRVSDWENGEALSPEIALRLWSRYASRLRKRGITLEDLLKHGRDGAGAAA
jgi:transcriptional regulator with XRE-family HTH domain